MAQLVHNLPTTQETRVQSLDWENPLEKAVATHSSILAWEIAWISVSWWATVHGVTRVRHDLMTKSPLPPPYHHSKEEKYQPNRTRKVIISSCNFSLNSSRVSHDH